MSLILQDSLVLSPQAKQQLQSDINNVNERLDTLEAASDCADVVGTKAELDSYNTQHYLFLLFRYTFYRGNTTMRVHVHLQDNVR